MYRRIFLPRILVLAMMAVMACALALPTAAQTRIRMMAANTSSGNLQSYPIPGPGQRIFQGLDPDIVMIQEFNIGSNTTSEINNFVSSTFGAGFSWSREAGAQIPNGVISRYPIIASGEWTDSQVSNRDFAWARIDVPGSKDLWAISVHLLTSGSGVRNSEATALRSYINANIPSGDYIVLGGDFNTDSRSESCISTLSSGGSLFVTSSPYPADGSNNTNTNANRNKPYDWVLADTDLDALETPVVIGSRTFNNGLVFDSRVYTPLAEVSPVQSGDSGASNMQHMAVVRDFMFPSTGDYQVMPTSVAFGQQNATAGPFNNSSVTISHNNNFTLNSVNFTGAYASEFTLVSPSLPASITANTPLTFRWTPASNDGASRNVTATFNTGGTPANFAISLSGTTLPPSGTSYTVSPTNVNFGTVSSENAPFNNSSVQVTVLEPFALTGVTFSGTGAGEFALVSPDLSSGNELPVTGNLNLTFRWSPYVNDGTSRNVTATVTTTGNPSSFNVTLQGQLQPAGSGGGVPLNIGGYKLQQQNSAMAYTIPANTIVQPGNVVVIARNATQSAFQSAWGVTLGSNVIYLDIGSDTGGIAINGGETYQVLTGSNVSVDGPTVAMSSGQNLQRTGAGAAASQSASWNITTNIGSGGGSPGIYAGSRLNNNGLIISEFSDASAFANEFVELFYDAAVSTPPSAPTGVVANAGDAEVLITWDAHPNPGVVGYDVYRATSPGGPFVKINPKLVTDTSYTDINVTNGEEYYYVVRAIDTPDQSSNSLPASATPTEEASVRPSHWMMY